VNWGRIFCRNNLFWIAFAVILLGGSILRVYNLGDRVLHNDESVNHLFLQRISQLGYFPYSHENYHGPVYFYLTWVFYFFFGDSEFILRFSSVLAGMFCAALPLMLRRHLGSYFVLLSSALIGFSSSTLYYSRYAIHESCFLLWTMLLFFSSYIYLQEFKDKYLYLAALAVALLVGTKETFIIVMACYLFSFAPLLILKRKDLIASLNKQNLGIAAGICLIAFLSFYTGFFRWSLGVREFISGIPQWLGRNSSDTGHFKEWGYYLSIIAGTPLTDLLKFNDVNIISRWRDVPYAAEPHTFVAIVLLIPLLIWEVYRNIKSRTYSPGALFIFWTVTAWGIYSFPVKYKTPWLIINLTVPAFLMLSWYIKEILNCFVRNNFFAFAARSIFLLGVIIIALNASWLLNFKYPLGNNNPFAYVHAHQNVKEVCRKISDYCSSAASCNVLVGLNSYWPIPYYLRRY
jgi:uncharacterized protein (TIGR03663 family)